MYHLVLHLLHVGSSIVNIITTYSLKDIKKINLLSDAVKFIVCSV